MISNIAISKTIYTNKKPKEKDIIYNKKWNILINKAINVNKSLKKLDNLISKTKKLYLSRINSLTNFISIC